MTNYIVITRHEDLWLVGPFSTNSAAADYGITAGDQLWDDDPRWQTIDLSNTYGLRVEAPDSSLVVVPGAYGRGCAPVRAGA